MQMQYASPCALSPYFSTGFSGVLTSHMLVAVFAQGGVLRNLTIRFGGLIPNIPLRDTTSLYIEFIPLIWNREEKEVKCPTLHHVSCVC